MNFRLKFWYIDEIGNTLTTSSIISSAVFGSVWTKIFRETSMNKLVHQGSQFELRLKLHREPMEFPEYQSNSSIFTRICNNSSCTVLYRLIYED